MNHVGAGHGPEFAPPAGMAEPEIPNERRKSTRDRRARPGVARPPRFSLAPLVVLFLGLVLLNQLFAPGRAKTVPYSEIKNRISAHQVKEVRIGTTSIEAIPDTSISKGDGPDKWRAERPAVEDPALIQLLEARNGIAAGTIAIDLMIETPQAILGDQGQIAVPSLLSEQLCVPPAAMPRRTDSGGGAPRARKLTLTLSASSSAATTSCSSPSPSTH